MSDNFFCLRTTVFFCKLVEYFKMDIRKFMKRKNDETDIETDAKSVKVESNIDDSECAIVENETKTQFAERDIGHFVNCPEKLNSTIRSNLISDPFVPGEDYNFKSDVKEGKRSFTRDWLFRKSFPWLVYSALMKGAFCLWCVIFPQPVTRGFQGSFIVKPFIDHKHFLECAENHVKSDWHVGAKTQFEHFVQNTRDVTKDIVCAMNDKIRQTVTENRSKLTSILSSIIYCATHDIALRGKTSQTGNLNDLFDLRVESGDSVLREHLQNAPANARYTSHQTQNELITTCGDILRKQIVNDVNKSTGFSILADETADISGTEQLSIGVRFVDLTPEPKIREEFLGFTPIIGPCDADHISQIILDQCAQYGLDLSKLMGQGYDGCSTMAGKENGVQARIKREHKNADLIVVHRIF